MSPSVRHNIVIGLALLAVWACSSDGGASDVIAPPNDEPVVVRLDLNPVADTLLSLGQSADFVATARDSRGIAISGVSVSWALSDSTVATIDQAGKVTAVSNGSTDVTAITGTVSARASVVVHQTAAVIDLSPSTDTLLSLGQSRKLVVTARDARGNAVSQILVSWALSDSSVATIDQAGKVTAVSNGSTDVIAAAGAVSARASVVVDQTPAVIERIAGDSQIATVAVALPESLVVRVSDALDNPMASIVLSWTDASGLGSFSPDTSVTDSSGMASAEWTLGATAGGQVAMAHAGSLVTVFGSQAVAGPASVITGLSNNPVEVIAGTVIDSVSVEVADQYGNSVSGVPVRWTVVTGSGSVTPAFATTDSQGIASARWVTDTTDGIVNTLSVDDVASSIVPLVISVTGVAPLAPFRFEHNLAWVSPNRTTTLPVLDALARLVPASRIRYTIESRLGGAPTGPRAGIVEVDANGTFRQAITRFVAMGYVVKATVVGASVDGAAFMVANWNDLDRVKVTTRHFRLVATQPAIDRALTFQPNLYSLIDRGWEIQRDLMGLTEAEAANNDNPSLAALGLDFTAVISNTVHSNVAHPGFPLKFGEDILAGPSAYFHELGHNNTIYSEGGFFLDLASGGRPYNEGEADMMALWTGYQLLQDPALPAFDRQWIEQYFDGGLFTDDAANLFPDWVASGNPIDSMLQTHWRSLHLIFIKEFGWDYRQRYVRAWRDDAKVRAWLGLPGPVTETQWATFVAAQVSAAIQQDARDRFKNWRFPVDDTLFQLLFDRFMVRMGEPW